MSFPSRLLGVAVGTGCTTNAGWTDPDFPTWTTAASLATSFVPTILTTFDQGATWQVRRTRPGRLDDVSCLDRLVSLAL